VRQSGESEGRRRGIVYFRYLINGVNWFTNGSILFSIFNVLN
jgi:hypothetical protein